MNIAHIINPVIVGQQSDLYTAQPITIQSMRIAKEYHKNGQVSLYACSFPEDLGILPEDFIQYPYLNRSVLDLNEFDIKRKLPLLADIINVLSNHSDADFFIYTNADIGVMPYFYNTVEEIIRSGHDAFVINRRSVPAHYNHPDQLGMIYSEAGEKHIGHDCFVFPASMAKELILEHICIGAPFVGRSLTWNMALLAENFKEFKDLHMTFHIGTDKPWKDGRYADYIKFNKGEATKVWKALKTKNNAIEQKLDEHNLLFGMDFLRNI